MSYDSDGFLIPMSEDLLSEKEAIYDDKHIIITRKAFERLGEYSCSMPTGAAPGKRWKCDLYAYDRTKTGSRWVIRGYDPSTVKHKCSNKQWEILEIIECVELPIGGAGHVSTS